MPEYSIRTARETDGAGITCLTTQLGYPVTEAESHARLRELLASTDNVVLVAETPDNQLAGWIHGVASQTLESGRRVEIMGLVVAAAWQRQGLGRALIQRVEDWAACRGIPQMVVRCQTQRQEAHGFYEALGYRPAKTQTVFRKPLN